MEFRKTVQPHLTVFRILAQSSFSSKNSNGSLRKLLMYNFPVIILLIFTLYTSISSLVYQYKYMRIFGVANSFVANSIIMNQLIANLIVIGQGTVYRKDLTLILKKLELVADVYQLKLDEQLCFTGFKRKYHIKVCICFIALTISAVVLVNFPLNTGDLLTSGHFFMLLFFTFVASMHALLYLESLSFFISVFNGNLKKCTKVMLFKNDKSVVVMLRHHKYIHLKLWEVSLLISRHFGWSLAVIHLQSFFIASYSVCWVFIFYKLQTSSMSWTRKYIPFYIHIYIYWFYAICLYSISIIYSTRFFIL